MSAPARSPPLFRACGDTPVGSRDATMLALLYGCGLRRSEAVTVELADYADGAVTIHHGKGRKERIVYPPPAARRPSMAGSRTEATGRDRCCVPSGRAVTSSNAA